MFYHSFLCFLQLACFDLHKAPGGAPNPAGGLGEQSSDEGRARASLLGRAVARFSYEVGVS
jgi:hypothetical protein